LTKRISYKGGGSFSPPFSVLPLQSSLGNRFSKAEKYRWETAENAQKAQFV
jgi:hypothetical protein